MKENKTICLLNDSFPPLIDGVANAVINYAEQLSKNEYNPMVITPSYPKADDKKFAYPVLRYHSISKLKFNGYPTGIPFSPDVAAKIGDSKVEILHTHCPIMSTFMARQLRQITHAPIIFTYHTKFDIDIANVVKRKAIQEACIKTVISNISACDEVWVVSKGAGENLRSLGYKGEYIVMPNGVDMPLGKVSSEKQEEATGKYNLPSDVPVYLFVGRMLWYKGLRIAIDALKNLKDNGKDFRMVFIGSGGNIDEVKDYIKQLGIDDKCIFTGPVYDREELRAWYSRVDLFLFPSSYDTNGLVVREAAASSTASVLIKGSCAAEDITDGRNGFLIEENAEAMTECLMSLTMEQMKEAGEHAANEIYISWETACKKVMERYEYVIEHYKNGNYPRKRSSSEGIMRMNGEMMRMLRIWHRIPHRRKKK